MIEIAAWVESVSIANLANAQGLCEFRASSLEQLVADEVQILYPGGHVVSTSSENIIQAFKAALRGSVTGRFLKLQPWDDFREIDIRFIYEGSVAASVKYVSRSHNLNFDGCRVSIPLESVLLLENSLHQTITAEGI